MSKTESFISKCCKGSTPFCIDLDEDDSYVIDVPKKNSDKK